MRYLITGGSGYIGGRLIDELSGREETELIVDVDVNPPRRHWPKTEFVKGDDLCRLTVIEGAGATHVDYTLARVNPGN